MNRRLRSTTIRFEGPRTHVDFGSLDPLLLTPSLSSHEERVVVGRSLKGAAAILSVVEPLIMVGE